MPLNRPPDSRSHASIQHASRRSVTEFDELDRKGIHSITETESESDLSSDGRKHKRAWSRRTLRGVIKKGPLSPYGTIVIRGQKLRPTVIFDTFWRFSAERKAIDDRRRSGAPAPWTDDPILQERHFCNPYRVLDRVTQYIITEVIEKGSQKPEEVVFRILLFNTFTKIETWELLDKELGPLTWFNYDRDAYQDILEAAKERGHAIYTNKFQKPGPKFGLQAMHMNHLALLEVFMENQLPQKLANAKYMADVYEWLAAFPGMGEFNTYQLLLNLSYSSVANFSGNDFVVAGLGAKSGLVKMFGQSYNSARTRVDGIEEDIIRWLQKTQDEHFQRLGLRFTGLGPNRLPMDVADIEHTLCEVDKYSRLAHPSFQGTLGRKHMRGSRFQPSSYLAREPKLPAAWSHPARKIARIRPRRVKVDKRYIIRSIDGHRKTSSGKIEYHVYWLNYSDACATWEPQEQLLTDAPEAVLAYRRNGNKRVRL